MDWSDDTAGHIAPRDAGALNPAEDWDAAMPPHDPQAHGSAAWCPVAIRLRGDDTATPWRAAADSLTAHLEAEAGGPGEVSLALDPLALSQLARLRNSPPEAAHLNGVVIHRPAAVAYAPVRTDAGAAAFEVIHVGPALRRARTVNAPEESTSPQTRPPAPPALIAIIDDSFAFAHARFRNAPADTRVQRFWAMDDQQRDGARMSAGTCFTKAGIDAALADAQGDETRLYRGALLRGLHHRGSHGTHVGDLAAGAEMGTGAPPILAVALPRSATADTSGGRIVTAALQALYRVIHWADTLYETPAPLVVNFSYGVHAGPKDGTGTIGAELTRLAEGRSANGAPTRIVLPAGNGFRARGRSCADLAPGQTHGVDWRLLPDDKTASFAELWLDGPPDATLRFAPPGGPPLDLRLAGTATCYTLHRGGVPVARVYAQPRGERLRVTLAVAPSMTPDHPGRAAPAGAWRIALTHAPEAAGPLRVAIDVQRDDTPSGFPAFGRQSYLDGPDVDATDPATGRRDMPVTGGHSTTRSGTLSAYTGRESDCVFVVGGAVASDGTAALYSGAGPTPGRAAPDLAATGDTSRTHRGLIAAGPVSGATATFAGTSGAAPQVARALATGLLCLPKSEALDALLARPLAARDPQLGWGVHGPVPGFGVQPLRRSAEDPETAPETAPTS